MNGPYTENDTTEGRARGLFFIAENGALNFRRRPKTSRFS